MAKWIGVITNVGDSVLSGWVEGKKLVIDQIMTSSGKVDEVALMAQTNLVSVRYTATAISQERTEQGRKLKIQISAAEQGYSMTQIGIWGHLDGDESKLIAIYQRDDNGIPIPSKVDSPDFIYTFFGTIATKNTGELTLVVDPSAFVSYGTLMEVINSSSRTITEEIVIPLSAWEATSGVYQAAVSIEGVTSEYYPIVTVHKTSRATAKCAGLDPAAETTDDSTLLFTAADVPDDMIYASVALIAPGTASGTQGSGGEGGSYTLLPATVARLGGVKIGDGVDVTPDGTLSVDTDSVLDSIVAPAGAMEAMLNEVFGPEREE